MTRLALVLTMLSSVVVLSPAAMAQSNGDTSGPAAGSNAKPTAAVQKENGASGENQTGQAGAPGTTAKPGTEAGPAVKPTK